MTTVLILGGTSEAAALAEVLAADPEFHVITSLAGRTRQPRDLPGEVRTGGFGGVSGLKEFLREHGIDAVIDATHPFAQQMSAHAAEACGGCAIPRLYLVRTLWPRHEGDCWHEVENAEEAAACLGDFGRRVFLTTGQQDLAAFAGLDDLWFLIRTVEPVEGAKPKQAHCLEARGPFSEDDERDLLTTHRIDVVVTKASGGEATYAKIAAARQLQLPVVMIKRPETPPGPKADNLEAALTWLQRQVTG